MQQQSILLVEDDENDAILIERALEEARVRCPVRTVRNAKAAMAYLDGREGYVDRQQYPFPSLVLLDWKMGGESGEGVLRWLQKRPQMRSRLVTVVLSAVEVPGAVSEAYALGANSFLAKPFAHQDLVKMAVRIREYWLELNRLE